MWFRAVGGLFACVLLAICAPARAWTSAQVKDVRARVVLSNDGAASVVLDLGIDVRGGWLERFDLEGLSPELQLDADRPGWLTTAEGNVVAARVTAHEGAVAVRFDKRDAARRGLHRLAIAFEAPLAQGAESGRLAFALPGFQQAIEAGEIVVDAPAGVRAVRDPESTTQVVERSAGERVEVTFRRSHWPRATPWVIEVARAVPSERLVSKPSGRPREVVAGALLAAFLAALGWLARRSFRRRARALGLRSEPWLHATRLHGWLLLASAIAMAVAWPFSLELSLTFGLALSVLFAERALPTGAAPRFSSMRALKGTDFRKARRASLRQRLGLAPWADAWTLAGLAGMSALVAAVVWSSSRTQMREPWSLALLCALPGWIASSRIRLPRSPAERLRRLLGTASRLRIEGCALRLLGHSDAQGELLEARIRVVPGIRYAGLLRVDLSEDSRRFVQMPSLTVVVRHGSPADRWLDKYFAPQERSLSAGGLRVAYVRSVADANVALDELLSYLSRESQAALQKQPVVVARAA